MFNLFVIAGRITFICMKYGRQWVRVIFKRYVWSKNSFYPVYVKLRIVFIRKLFVTSPSRLLRIVSTDSLAFRLFCFNIRQHQILYLNNKWTAANFIIEGYMLSQVVHRCSKLIPISTSRLIGWIRPFPSVTAWELGRLANVVTVMFVLRMSRSQRLQSSSATRSGRRGGVP